MRTKRDHYVTVEEVEFWLPVGQCPPEALIDQKASWRGRVPEADFENAMKEIAKSYLSVGRGLPSWPGRAGRRRSSAA